MSDLHSEDSKCLRCGAPMEARASTPLCLRCLMQQSTLSSAGDPEAMGDCSLFLADLPQPGDQVAYVGDFELLELIARGGMGVVYRARQRSLEREVAVKLMMIGSGPAQAERSRFLNEARTAARLQHPSIVSAFEIGEHEGQPYFAMDLVTDTEGRPAQNLASVLRDRPMAPTRAGKLMRVAAETIAYAHGCQVLHRDIKPSNILIGRNGEPRLTDFGVARRLDQDSELTGTGQIVGTPGFMAPEQVSFNYGEVGCAADVYGLGATLYCLLTGRPPFASNSLKETLDQVCEADPISPRVLNPEVALELEVICLKCLQKQPADRYASAQELADDLGRWERGEPLRAKPVGTVERMGKWIKRNRVAAAGIGAVGLALFLGLLTTLWQRDQAVAQAQRAQQHAREAQIRLQETHALTDEMQLRTAQQLVASEAQPEALAHLAQILRRTPNHLEAIRWTFNLLQSRGWSGPPLMSLQHTGAVAWVEFSPDGSRLASVGLDGTVRLWDPRSGAPIGLPFRPSGEALLTKIAFTPNGSRLVTSFTSAWGQDKAPSNTVFFHNASTSEQMARVAAPYRRRVGADFDIHPLGGELLLSFQASHVEVWDLEQARRIRTVAHQDSGVEGARYSPDATRFLTMDTNCLVQVWDTAAGRPVGTRIQHSSEAGGLYHFSDIGFPSLGMAQFSQNGKLILTHSIDNALRLWDAESGLPFGSRMESADPNCELLFGTFNPDSKKVLGWGFHTDESSTDIETWVTETTARTNSLRVDRPSGANRVSQGVKPLTLAEQSAPQALPESLQIGYMFGFNHENGGLYWNPSSSRFASVPAYCEDIGDPFSIRFQLVDLQESKVIQQGQPYWITLPPQLSSDGGTLLATHIVSGVTSFDFRKNHALGWPLRPAGRCFGAWFHPLGQQIATASEAGVVDLWRRPSQAGYFNGLPTKETWSWIPPQINQSGDRALMMTGRGREGEVWDVDNSRMIARFGEHESWEDHAIFASFADGRYVVGGLSGPPLRVWEAGTGQAVGTILKYSTNAVSVQVNHDASQAMIKTRDGQLELWDQRRGTRILMPESDGYRASNATLSDAGNLLVAADATELLVWQIGSTVENPRRIPLDGWKVDAISCSPKGDQVVMAQQRLDTSARRLLLYTPDAAQPFHVWDGLEAHAFTWSGRGGLLLARSDHAFWVIHLRDRSVVRKVSPNLGIEGGAAFDPEEKVLWILEKQQITPYDVHTLAPSGPSLQVESHRCGISLTRDGKHLVLTDWRLGTIELWLMALPPQSTLAPPWLADLAELAAGLKLGTNRLFEVIPPKGVADGFATLRNIAASSDEGKWLHWYTDRSQDRKISPWRDLSEKDYVGRLVASGNEQNLEKALSLAPEDTMIWDKLASVLEAKKEDPESAFRARMFRERLSRLRH